MKRFISAVILFTGVAMSVPAQANTVVAPLSDGRLEMWYTDNGKIMVYLANIHRTQRRLDTGYWIELAFQRACGCGECVLAPGWALAVVCE